MPSCNYTGGMQLLEPMLPGAQILGEDAAERRICTVNPATGGDSVRHVHLATLSARGYWLGPYGLLWARGL